MNGIFYYSHPNIYKFIDALKNVQKVIQIKICSNSRTKKIKCELCAILGKQMIKYDVDEIIRFEYLKTVIIQMFTIDNS